MVDAFVCLQYFHLQQGDGGGSLTRATIGFFDTSGEQYLAQITHITDVSFVRSDKRRQVTKRRANIKTNCGVVDV